MSCAKTADPIEMQFGMLSRVSPGNVLHGDGDPPGRTLLKMSGLLKGIVKPRILGLGKRVVCKKWVDRSYDVFLRKELPFSGCDDCSCTNIFSGK